MDRLCTCLLYGPAPADDALRRCVEMLRGVSRNLLMQANIASSLTGLLAMRSRFDEARTAYRRAEAIYDDLGLRLPLAGLRGIAGEVELLADEPVAAQRQLELAYGIVDSGAPGAVFAALLGRALIAQERFDEAIELANTSHQSCGDDVWARIVCLGLESRIEVHRGSPGDAVGLAEEAVSLAEGTDALNVHGDALVDLAHALSSADRGSEARDALEQAHELYERKGNLVSAGRISAVLEERV